MRKNKKVSESEGAVYDEAMTNCYDIAKTLGLRYDGLMCGLFHQFSETDKSKASYGASFYVRINGQNLKSVAAKQQEVLVRFSKNRGARISEAREKWPTKHYGTSHVKRAEKPKRKGK